MNRANKILQVSIAVVISVVIVMDILSMGIEAFNCLTMSIINIIILLSTLIYLCAEIKIRQKLIRSSNTLMAKLKDKDLFIEKKEEIIRRNEFKIEQLSKEITKYISEVDALHFENSRLQVENHELKDSLDNALEKKYRPILEFLSNTWHDADSFEEADRVFIKKQVERLMRSLNYSFVDYSDETQSFYQTELSDEKEVITTKRAIKNTSTNKVAIKGIAYIPHVL